MPGGINSIPSFLQGFFGDNPGVAYAGSLANASRSAGRGGNSAFNQYYRGRGNEVYGEYVESYGRDLLGGGAGDQTYVDYLASYPWLKNFYTLSPAQRGETPTRFTPRVRYSG